MVLQGDDAGLVRVAEVAFVLTGLRTRLVTGLARLLSVLSRLLTGLHAKLLHGLPQVGGGLLQRFGRIGRSARWLAGLSLLRLAVLGWLSLAGHRGSFSGLLALGGLPLIVGQLLTDLVQLLSRLCDVQRPFRRQRRVAPRFLTLSRLLARLLSLLAGLLLTRGLSQLTGIAKSLSGIGSLLSRFLRVALLEVLLGSLHRGLGLLSGVLRRLGFLCLVLLLERLNAE